MDDQGASSRQTQADAVQEPQTAPAPGGTFPPTFKPGAQGISRRNLVAAAVAIVVIAAVLLAVTSHPAAPTTISTTTLQQAGASAISGCSTISKPGAYYLSGNLNYTQASGACLTIEASDVALNGKGHRITGSGPFSDTQPYSYGVLLQGVSNVSMSNVTVQRFSYDMFMNSTSGSNVSYSNFTNATLSGIYMLAAYNNSVVHDHVSVSQSKQGGIYIASGSGNSFSNVVSSGNAYYGLVLDSAGNSFSNDVFSSNPVDLVCNAASAPTSAGAFSNSTCSVNDFCGFASCSTNVPFNFSSVSLTPGPIDTCGTIYASGNYTLSGYISTSAYAGRQSSLSNGVSCIRILAPDVRLSCSGHQIKGSSYGVYVGQVPNASISDCLLENDTYGVYMYKSLGPQVANSTFSNDTYGLFMNGTSAGSISDNRLLFNTYGLFVNSSPGTLFYNTNARNNSYGIYVNTGYGSVFNGGSSSNNTNSDIYCSPYTYNSTTDLAQSFSCGLTSCKWASASCKQTVLPSLSVYPVSACRTITRPGTYELGQDLIAQSTCLSIAASDVALSCNGHSVRGSGFGSAFLVGNETNVSISNCTASNFAFGINASGSTHLKLQSDSFSGVSAGFRLYNVTYSTLASLHVSGATGYGFNLTRLAASSVVNSTASTGASSAYGFAFINATRNSIGFDSATSNPGYGFYFKNARNNTVYNNSASSNKAGDYVCSGTSTGVYSNPISVDSGITKTGCDWLVETSGVVQGPSCTSFFSPSSVVFKRDLLFTSGSICFGVYANSAGSANTTSIDCAGHTVYAEHGGTFAEISNASNVRISDCLLVNFTTGVQGNGQSASIHNNTIVYAGNAIVLSGRFSSVYGNRIQNGTNGIMIENTTEVSVYNNRLYNNINSLVFSNASSATITNNTAQESVYGAYLENTVRSTMQGNIFGDASKADVYCAGTSLGNGSSNIDSGSNVCQAASNCGWFSVSSTCR